MGGFTEWLLTNYPNVAMDFATFFQILNTRGLGAALMAANAATAVVIGQYLLRRRGGLLKFLKELFFSAIKVVPGVTGVVDKEVAKVAKDIKKKLVHDTLGDEVRYETLPKRGMPEDELMSTLARYTGKDEKLWRPGKVSGCIYHGGDGLTSVIAKAYEMFCLSNPLHPDVFPMVRKMEAEVVSWTLNLFNGGPGAAGTMTSGGTESILMAVKACRDMAEKERGVTEPEMVVPATAHAAFDKAAYYFKINIIRTPVDPTTFRADVGAMKKAISKNTILLVGSAPQFPQGVFDPIQDIGALGVKHKIPVHVDCCLGSYLVPFLDAAGYPTAPFDFRVPGVTSISADTHKFGYAPKGTSVVMYSTRELRHYQFFVVTDWPGGVYASPSIAGSRPGALVAGCWAALMKMGYDGYLDACKRIMGAATRIREGIQDVPGIVMQGDQDTSVVCFTTDGSINVFAVGDELSARKWNLNILQFPAGLHLCVTFANHERADDFVEDVKAAVKAVRSTPSSEYKDGMAAIYGLAETLPDRSIVGNIAEKYIEAMFDTGGSS